MNSDAEKNHDSYRSFLLISEISKEETLSQRELASRLGIALGLVNSYLKNLVSKGFVRVRNFPKNRYGYLLTPQGLAEKSRLAYQHLSYFTGLYTAARQDYLDLFQRLKNEGVLQVTFCGVDEVAEIAYLSLKEIGLELAVVMDDECVGQFFMGNVVQSLTLVKEAELPRIVITSLKRADSLLTALENQGIDRRTVFCLLSRYN